MPGCALKKAVRSRVLSGPANGRRLAWIVFLGLLRVACTSAFAAPQEEPPQQPAQPEEPGAAAVEPATAQSPASIARASVHGVVKNVATGAPIPRALVRIEGDAISGALTDGEGRFEIGGVPLGPQAFQVMKPGFIDTASAGMGGPPTVVNGATNSEHHVYVAYEMPDLAFSMAPTNAIHGQVELSTGDAAQGIAVMLLRRTVQDGRSVWQPVTNARTNNDGAYRFAGLTDGIYAVFTEPAMDSDIPAGFVAAGSGQAVTRGGYPSVFYPDGADLAGAGRIQVSGGQQAQANLLLTEQPFNLVRAAVTLPHAGPQMNVNVMVLDAQGHPLPYAGQYDGASHSVQAFLPDGTYAFQVTAIGAPPAVHLAEGRTTNISIGRFENGRLERFPAQGPMIGRVEFSVAGHPLTHLQVPLAAPQSNSIQVSVIRSGSESRPAQNNAGQAPPIVVMLSQAGGTINDGMVTSFAEGYATGPIETSPDIGPGAYWVHTTIPQKTLCEGSFTAGGASLAREPLVLSLTGASAPLTLTLRDDCASLRVSLPPEADTYATGDEAFYTIYVIPDFDSTADIMPVVLRPSSGGMLIVEGLTPGSYHVYTFASPVQLEYRNPEAMAALTNVGQAVTLTPGESASLVVEVPGH